MTTAAKTDPALWTSRPLFGVAGGPIVVVLTDYGQARAFSVGAQVRPGRPTEAMMALAATGGSGALSERVGRKLIPTALMRFDMTVWGVLTDLGYCEQWYDASGDGVRLTAAGRAAATNGVAEQGRLLERCRRAAGVPTTPRATVQFF